MRIIPAYKEIAITLLANEVFTLNRVGDALSFIQVSGGPFVMSIDEGEESDVRSGVGYKMPAGAEFKRITFRETGGVGGNITVAVARGTIFDNRASVSGSAFPVLNASAPDNILHTDLAAADPGLVALALQLSVDIANIANNQNDSIAKRPHVTSLNGFTHRKATAEGAEATIVTAVANVNGIHVALASCFRFSTGTRSYFGAGAGKMFVGFDLVSGASSSPVDSNVSNVLIPAGVALVGWADTNAQNSIWYRVL